MQQYRRSVNRSSSPFYPYSPYTNHNPSIPISNFKNPYYLHTYLTSQNQKRQKYSHRFYSQKPVIFPLTKSAYLCQKGHSFYNHSKPNQDSVICQPILQEHRQISLFAVCDGHGQNGRKVSQFISNRLPTLLSSDPHLYQKPRRALLSSLLRINTQLNQQNFDTNLSGSTCNACLIYNNQVICANIGDSRAFIGRYTNKWTAFGISKDHKADNRKEYARITRCGGRIGRRKDQEGNDIGPARVWMPDQEIPGIAMSRSLGDFLVSKVGVVCDPEISETILGFQDKFLFVGSDGVFEQLENEEVLEIVVPFLKKKSPEAACEAVYQAAKAK